MSPRVVPAACRRWSLSLVVLLLLGVIAPLLPLHLAGAASTLPEAVTDAVAAGGLQAPAGLHIAPAREQKHWSFGTAVLIGTERGDGPPDVVFYIARQQGRGWKAAIEADHESFRQLVHDAPAGFVPDVFQSAKTGVNAQAAPNVSNLNLGMPFAPGEGWNLLSGPHTEVGSAARNAIDLAPASGSPPGSVHPAYGGFATTPCQDNESTDGGPLVVVKHYGNWETHYFHLSGTVHLNGVVDVTDVLGYTSTRTSGGGCSGTADGPHVHFSLHFTGGSGASNYPIGGIWVGGWLVKNGSDERNGCLTSKRIFYHDEQGPFLKVCPGDYIYNNGELGSGAEISHQKLVEGEIGKIGIRNLPPRAQVTIVINYRPAGSKTRIDKTITTITVNGAGSHRAVKFRVPDTSGGMFIKAVRSPSVGDGDIFENLHVPVSRKR